MYISLNLYSLTDNTIKWTYKIEDGTCTDSMAIKTADEYGISNELIQRWEEITSQFDTLYRKNSANTHFIMTSSSHEYHSNDHVKSSNDISNNNDVRDGTNNGSINSVSTNPQPEVVSDVNIHPSGTTNTNTEVVVSMAFDTPWMNSLATMNTGITMNNDITVDTSATVDATTSTMNSTTTTPSTKPKRNSKNNLSSVKVQMTNNTVDIFETNSSDIDNSNINTDMNIVQQQQQPWLSSNDTHSEKDNLNNSNLDSELVATTNDNANNNMIIPTSIYNNIIPIPTNTTMTTTDSSNNDMILITEHMSVVTAAAIRPTKPKKGNKKTKLPISPPSTTTNAITDVESTAPSVASTVATTTATTINTTEELSLLSSNNNVVEPNVIQPDVSDITIIDTSSNDNININSETPDCQQSLPPQQSEPVMITYDKQLQNTFKTYKLETILPSIQQIAGVKTSSIHFVGQGQNPPLKLERQSCVYILHIFKNPDVFYVGQTNSIVQRLNQHRQTYKQHAIRVMVFPTPNSDIVRLCIDT